MTSETYTLYGSYASYYTAKTRSYLRKKGIPFIERLPSSPRFREHVRPTSGSHRIPQLETPDGKVLQDSIEIFDTLESRFPKLPALPPTPCQRLAVHLMELLGSEGLLRLAWQHRWYFPENDYFVKMDFGRSFRPQGTDEELLHYGNVIADRMLTRGQLDITDAARVALDAEYVTLLERLEAHFIAHPYMLGGHPSAADYALMGALFAHMGRDPAGLRVMQNNAPRTFRWIEHMNTPEVQSPEWPEREVAYPEDDQLPATFVDLIAHLVDRYVDDFERNAIAFGQAVDTGLVATDQPISGAGDQPLLEAVDVDLDGRVTPVRCNLYAVWVSQRALRYYQSLDESVQADCAGFLDSIGASRFVSTRTPPLIRVDNRLQLG